MESSTRRRRRAARTIVAGVGVSLLLTGCGFNAQTLQPYTPAHGVNVDVPSGEDGRQLKVRNLLLVSDDAGQGVVSASIVSPVADSLVKIEGAAHKVDNTPGSPLTVSGGPVEILPNRMAVLTDGDVKGFTVSGADLQPGLTADLVLTFESGAQVKAIAPVMSSDSAIYSSITPAPAATTPAATAAATPAPSATPTP